MHVCIQCDSAQNWQECSMQPTSGRSQNLSAWALLSAAGAQKWECANGISCFNTHGINAQLFCSLTSVQNCRIFFFSVQPFWGIRNSCAHGCKSLIQEQNELGDGAAVEAGLQCVGGTGIISFPESLVLKCSNSQVSALAYRVGNIFVLPKVQLLTLARQLLFPVSRNPICSRKEVTPLQSQQTKSLHVCTVFSA